MMFRNFHHKNSLLTITLVTMVFYVVEVLGCSPLCKCTGAYYAYCDKKGITSAQISEVMKYIPQTVTYVDFSQNFLHKLEKDLFTKHTSLWELNFQGNRLQEIQANTFKPLASLRKLYLNHNNLTEIGKGIFANLTNLKILHLQNNNIQTLDEEAFLSLTSLEELCLRGNAISQISPTVFQNLPNLVHLDLSSNHLISVDNMCLGKVPKLKTLLLGKNLISQLSDVTFLGLKTLKIIDLSHNKLRSIRRIHLDPFISSIEDINLSSNFLQEIEANVFQNIFSLRWLNLAHNLIVAIQTEGFKSLELDFLNLQGNKLTSISREIFRTCKRIKELDLSHNELSEIMTGAFDSVRGTLYVLDLSHNRLNHVRAGMIRSLTYLQNLDLSSNVIEMIDSGAFSDLESLSLLNLESNLITSLYAADDQGLRQTVRQISLVKNPLQTFSGYIFTHPVKIYMNLTLFDVTETSVSVAWPFRDGGQIYWTVQVQRLGNQSQTGGENPEIKYVQGSRTGVQIQGLHENTVYYICVTPNFVNSQTDIIQCSMLKTLEKNITSTLTPSTQYLQLPSSSAIFHISWHIIFCVIFSIFL